MLTQAWPRVTWSKRDPTVKSRRSASYEKSRIRTSGMVFVTRSRAALETAVLYRYKAEGGGVESKGPNGQITAKRVLWEKSNSLVRNGNAWVGSALPWDCLSRHEHGNDSLFLRCRWTRFLHRGSLAHVLRIQLIFFSLLIYLERLREFDSYRHPNEKKLTKQL